MRILDLGCGTAKEKGTIGADIVPLPDVDVIANLAEYPYPFADNSFDDIYLNDVIEHLPDTIATMEEIYRIARPDARVFIRVVNWNSHYTAMDPTHVKAFTENSFDFFGKRVGRSYYSHARFDVVRVDYQYSARAKKHFRSERLMKFLSFYLCNVLEGLNFELRVVKDVDTTENHMGDDISDFFSILRCPHCVGGKPGKQEDDPGRLELSQDCWLVCQEEGCERRYPVYDSLPIMLREEAEKWINISVKDLPVPPPGKLKRIPVNIPSAEPCAADSAVPQSKGDRFVTRLLRRARSKIMFIVNKHFN